MKEPLAAILGALALHHIALVDQLLEHAAERLLGDLQNVEQVGNLDAGIAVDEMQHAVMRPAETELGQHLVRVGDEIAVGEEQELDQVPARLLGAVIFAALGSRRDASGGLSRIGGGMQLSGRGDADISHLGQHY